MEKTAKSLKPYLTSISQYFAYDAILSSQQLKRLSEHKYSSQDNSYLDVLMQHFWNRVVKWFPLWLAPNLITITGLALNIASVLMLAYYNPDGKQKAPCWTYFICAVTLFLYQTMDAIDGKQARRTNSSSPLGELFDHGCDSLSQVFVALEVSLTVLLGAYPNYLLFSCIMAEVLFYVAHWQVYASGTLTFGRFDVTEAQFTVIALCLCSAFIGTDIWSKQVLFGYELKLILVGISCAIGLYNVIRYFRIIFTRGAGKNGSTVAGTSILYPVFPLLSIILPQVIIYSRSRTTDFTDHIVLYCILFGVISAKITNKLVVAHMTKSTLTLWDTIFYGPLAVGFNQYLGTLVSEYWILILALIYCCVNFSCYCKELCENICSYLGIHCFRIPYGTSSRDTTISRAAANTGGRGTTISSNGSAGGSSNHHTTATDYNKNISLQDKKVVSNSVQPKQEKIQ